MHDALVVFELQVDAVAGLDAAADDPRDLLQEGADVALDRRCLFICEYLVGPLGHGCNAPDGVDERVAPRQVTAAKLLQVAFKRTSDVVVKGLHDLVGSAPWYAEGSLYSRHDRLT